MDAFNRVVSTVSEAFVFNQATLSGSVDIIIVKQKDGSYKGTGFHARFGKVHAIKSKDRIVQIEINNVRTNVTMKLGDGGEAYFEDEVIDSAENELSDDSLQHENSPSLENILYNSGSNSESKSQRNRIELLNNVEPAQAKVERLVSSKITDNIDKHNALCQSDSKAEKENELYTEIDKENRSSSSVAKKINTGITATAKVQSDSDPETSILSSTQKASQNKTSRIRRGLRLSSEKIKLLNLRPGQNTITYIINTGLQGTQKLHANVYLWSYNTKLIVTDVDGTITKSDFLGAILPLLGKDWTQPGIAPLFANIHRNGYQILYLTSRAIGQIGFTRDFVKSVHQDGKNLPQGPIISSPDQLLSCFKREIVFSKPEFFKSAALRDIRNLFPADQNPFHAGFGNRENDAVAYRFVGIPLENIFTVNGNGEVHHAAHTLYKSYAYLNAKVKEIFPCIHIH